MQAKSDNYVQRAIFLAAGFGVRMAPLSFTTPKPLIEVNGKRIIDTMIDAVLNAGIEEVYIIRGYLAEKFDVLLEKYPMIKFIENKDYDKANNISSCVYAGELLCNAYLIEADLFLSNKKLIQPYQECTNFLAIPVEKTDDWCFSANGKIITEHKIGGTNCWQEVGISYWTQEDGKKLAAHYREAYKMQGGFNFCWDEVPLRLFKDEYKIVVRECTKEDIVEIDTFEELKAIDSSYRCN